jgi:hypothetical protein
VESTARLHNRIAHSILLEAYFVFHHPITLHPTDRVFDTDSDGRDHAMLCFLRWGKFTPPGLFLRLDDRDPVQHTALDSHIVIEVTPAGESITGQLREAFVMVLTFHGRTQEAEVTGLIDAQEVFDGVTRLLAAVVVLLGL